MLSIAIKVWKLLRVHSIFVVLSWLMYPDPDPVYRVSVLDTGFLWNFLFT